MIESPEQYTPGINDQAPNPSQLAIKDFCNAMLAWPGLHNTDANQRDILTTANPLEVQEILRTSSVRDLLLQDKDTLLTFPSDSPSNRHLFVGETDIEAVTVSGWTWHEEGRPVADESPELLFALLVKEQWAGGLDIKLHYADGENSIFQIITAYTNTFNSGALPMMSRHVYATVYAGDGYWGHSQVSRPAKHAFEVTEFVALVQELCNHPAF